MTLFPLDEDAPAKVEHPPFNFIVGCPRSGTTLIRVMLNESNTMALFPESRIVARYARHRNRYERSDGFDIGRFAMDVFNHEKAFQWKLDEDEVRRGFAKDRPTDYPDAVRSLFASFARQHGKPRYGDKTPTYVVDVLLLARLFPESRFVHVIRDGRKTALSLLENRFVSSSVPHAMRYWATRVRAARTAGALLPADRYMEYRHEDLVRDPDPTLREICRFMDIPFEDDMLNYHEKQRSSAHYGSRNMDKPPTETRDWRSEMSRDDLRLCEILDGDLLAELGYPLETTIGPGETTLQRKAAEIARQQSIWEKAWFKRVTRAPNEPIVKSA
jgi:hypothetical protein